MPAEPVPGRPPVVPGYTVEELLGRGGSGEVWRARPRSGGLPVAVKVLVRGDPARQAREAALLGELDHPHLVHLHEVVRRVVRGAPDQVTLVLDLLEGGSLASLLARRGRLRPGEVVTTVSPIAAALAHAHERGVVHGDLSPGNIVFTGVGRPVLTDLGVARVLGDAARAEVTPAYVDPTVARGGAPGPASDVFGVAAAAFHALTGVAPWNAAGPAETLRVAAGGQLPDLDLLAPEAPDQLRAVIRRGLSPDPHERGSAAAFALDLRHSCRPEPVRLPVAGVPDEELGSTGRGPRTELTHQVPGRASRAVHAAPAPPSLLARLRRRREVGAVPAEVLWATVRRVAAVLAVLAAVAGAGWLGVRWGGAAHQAEARTTSAVAVRTTPAPSPSAAPGDGPVVPPAAATTTPPVPSPTSTRPQPSPVPTGGAPVPDPRSGDLAGWQRLVGDLYARRAEAFARADAGLLAGVYVAGSDLDARDRGRIEELRSAGERLVGFTPSVSAIEGVRLDGDDAEVTLVDTYPAYRVAPAAGDPSAGRVVDGRGEQQVTMQLTRTADGWRLVTAWRSP